ncbi:MAG TPA: MFS transporter [Luteibacter sp.]|jgi:putative MFS transporter|nr:MFS transporter [Luteibacter sp.]
MTTQVIEGFGTTAGDVVARLERLPVSRPLVWARIVVGSATFFDGYTTLAIAYAMPVLAKIWHLQPAEIGLIISSGYLGQLIGALFFGWLAERIGRLPTLAITVSIFAVMSVFCIFSWSAASLMAFRFVQGIGTGGEVPVASAYVNEFIGARRRGRFFLLYELLFLVGLVFAALIGYFLVPVYGWKTMFWIGVLPVALTVPLRFFLPESPRWLLTHGRIEQASEVVAKLERDIRKRGIPLPAPAASVELPSISQRGSWRDLFSGIYRKRTLVLWTLWFCSYLINNGLATWLPTLYRTVFDIPLQTSLLYGLIMTSVAVVVSFVCAITIDKVGRRPWYIGAFLLAIVPMLVLWLTGAGTAMRILVLATCTYAIIQTVTYSLYLYSAELYPTRMRAVGAGLGSAWLRAGSMAGPALIGFVVAESGIALVFGAFALVALIGGVVCALFAVESKGRVLEELSP